VRPGAAILALPLSCTAAQFFSRLEQAINDVTKRTPRQDLADTIPHSNGSTTYIRTDGLSVTYNKRGFPEFEPHHLWPNAGQAQVWIEFRCDRDWERTESNRRAFPEGGVPDDHTWHHSHKFRNRGGKVEILMQLVRNNVHGWAQHTGGYGVGKTVLGPGACR
jgi:hypothetical protein